MTQGPEPKPAGIFEGLVDRMVTTSGSLADLPSADELVTELGLAPDMANAARNWAARRVKDKVMGREIPLSDFFVPENGFSPIATMQEVEDGVFRFVYPSGIQFPRDLTEFFSEK